MADETVHRMSKQTCIELIKLFESHRLLWDPLTPNFYNKKLKEHAWKDISYKIKIPVNEIKQKITNLRGVLRKERFRSRHFSHAGGAAYKSRWFALKHLSFLEDVRYNQTRIADSQPSTSEQKNDNSETEIVPDEKEDSNSRTSDGDNPFATTAVWMEEEDTITDSPMIGKNTKLNKISQKVQNQDQLDDNYDTFGKLVASELRKYDYHTLAHVKKAIMDIIFQADTGNFPGIKMELNNEY